MARKKTFCADTSEMSETEKKIMATAMKAGQDQINIIREQQAVENPKRDDSDES